MCGIAGIWGAIDETNVRNMIDAQRHRGPDGQGLHIDVKNGVLGHTRLAIMDPAMGQQPIHNENRSAALVANAGADLVIFLGALIIIMLQTATAKPYSTCLKTMAQ